MKSQISKFVFVPNSRNPNPGARQQL